MEHDAATWGLAIFILAALFALIRNVVILIFKVTDRFKPASRPCEYIVRLQEQVNETNITVARELSTLRANVEAITKELSNGMGFARRAQYERKSKNDSEQDF